MASVQAVRDDDDNKSRLIIRDILQKIEDSDLVVCDLSSNNPNVFVELGWALRADKPYVLIGDEHTNLEFDLKQNYKSNYNSALRPKQLEKDIKSLSSTINKTLNDEKRSFSLVNQLGLSAEVIAAAKEGNFNGKILLEILNIKTSIQNLESQRSISRGQQFSIREKSRKRSTGKWVAERWGEVFLGCFLGGAPT